MLKIKNELYFYDIYPKVIPVNREVTITIKPLSLQTFFKPENEYKIEIYPIDSDVYTASKPPIKSYNAKTIDGKLCFTHIFDSEQEYSIRVSLLNEENNNGYIAKLSIYALENDLMERRPLIGDFHVHTCFSDGRESPEFVAAMYRQQGYDFTSITDHHRYKPSLRAIDIYKELDLDFKIYRGEEIHTPNNTVHLVNFGSDFSVNEFYREDTGEMGEIKDNEEGKKQWFEEVAKIQETLVDLPKGVDPFVHASCLLAIKKVHEGNGMCMFAHPHWLWDVRNVTDAFTRYYLENSIADAFELIGGQTWHENMTQVALYHELRSKGAVIPIVGSSDSHGTVNPKHADGCSYFTEERTMVFACENTRDDIVSAVKNLYSVAVDHYVGQDFHINGPYRLVQYALFLYENYFPLQSELCYEEGRLMRMYINGSEEAKDRLDSLKGQTQRLFEKYFLR